MNSGLYYEDFSVGDSFLSHGRTITEADLTLFSMISGDWNPIHSDAEYAKTTRYEQRLVHGTFGISIMTGMMHNMGIFSGTAVAMQSIQDWKFLKPVFVGDTLHLELIVTEKIDKNHPKMASIMRKLRLINQHKEIAHEGLSDVLLLRKNPL